ncbi:MAG: hypothetical protein H8D23_07850 [Candidatus Brocadiales bacterium]|nr:hypothetical protein [Candidatus Brocadiales bacterium]
MKQLKWLDDATKINLSVYDYKEYLRYKNRLQDEENLDSIEDILTGFIWDCTDSYEDYK